MTLISRPDLGIANEELLAAQAIARTTGELSVDLIDSYIAKFAELRKLVEAGSLMPCARQNDGIRIWRIWFGYWRMPV